MNTRHAIRNMFTFVFVVAAVALASTTHAATLYFDGSNVTSANGASDLTLNTSGTPHIWDTTTANWDNGSSYVTWNNGDDAVIAGAGGNKWISLANSVTVGTFSWPSGGGTTFFDPASSQTITVNSGINFGSPAGVQWSVPIILGGNQIWSMGGTNSTGKSIDGGTDLNGHTLTWNTTGTNTNTNAHPGHSNITGSGSLEKTGVGYVKLLGTNTYTGSTTVNNGAIIIQSASALGNVNNQLTVNTGGTLNMSNQSLTVGNLTGAGGVITSTHTSGTRTLTIGSGDTGGGNFQGVIENGITGSTTALTKTGNGTITLSGANTYTGGTIINGGRLLVNNTTGSGTGLGSVTVNASGTLGGTGTIGGATIIDGNLNPGASPGVLSFEDTLALGGSSTTTLEIDGTTRDSEYDGVDVAGALTYGGELVLDFGTTFGLGVYTFDLFNSDSASGAFDTVTLAGAYSGSLALNSGVWSFVSGKNTWEFAQSTGELSLSNIPEPSTAILAGLGLVGVCFRRRRRSA